MSDNFDQAAKSWDTQQYRHERAREVAEKILDSVKLSSSSSLMDFGCGTGLLGFNFTGIAGSVAFADTSSGMLEVVDEKIKACKITNASTVLLQNGNSQFTGKFDCIVSLQALHHVSDYKGCLKALADALNAGGCIAISDLDKEDGSFHSGDTSVHWGFDREEIKSIYAESGLTDISESTPFINTKATSTGVKDFQLFLITGRKPSI